MTINDLCRDQHQSQNLRSFYEHIFSLNFKEEPDYERLVFLISKFRSEGAISEGNTQRVPKISQLNQIDMLNSTIALSSRLLCTSRVGTQQKRFDIFSEADYDFSSNISSSMSSNSLRNTLKAKKLIRKRHNKYLASGPSYNEDHKGLMKQRIQKRSNKI